MPLYEYECRKCGTRFERIVKFSDPPVVRCPKCGGRVDKQVSSPAFQFKGSGWYVTDYARKGESGGSSKKGTDGGKDEGSSPAAADAKPAADGAAAKAETPAHAKSKKAKKDD